MLDRLEADHRELGDLSEEHRQVEEQVVLAAFVEHGGNPNDPRIVPMLTEHVRLRAGEGTLVEAHERFGDDVVFPLIRSVLAADPPRPPVEPLSHELVLKPPGSEPRRESLRRVYAVAGPLVDADGVSRRPSRSRSSSSEGTSIVDRACPPMPRSTLSWRA